LRLTFPPPSLSISAGSAKEEEIRTLGRGDYFGEQALIKEDKRTASIIACEPGVECLTLDRESFNQHIGDLIELHQRDYGDKDRIYAIKNLKNKHIPIIDRSEFLKGSCRLPLSLRGGRIMNFDGFSSP
jgi:CRP-like cAMP-binding protein